MAGLISVRTICSYVGRGMQGNNALLGKTLKKIQNQSERPSRFSFLISVKFVVRAAVECFNEH